MPSVRILTACIVAGKPQSAGDVLNVSDADAGSLLSLRRAESYTPPPAAPLTAQQRIEAKRAAVDAAQAALDAELKADGE